MERLTERNENGEAYYKRCYESPCDGTGEACDDCNFIDIKVCEALAAYEDNGITPEQMREISRLYQIKCEELNKVNAELAEYKQAEDQGVLLKLPCKVGDTVYIVGMLGSPEIEEWEITGITMRWGENDEPYFYADLKRAKGNNCSFWMKEFGRSVFTTKSEAEQALEKMKNN